MGTSGAYGGSGRQDWTNAGEALADLPADGPPSGGGGSGDVTDPPIEDFWQGVADALAGEDPTLRRPLPTGDPFPLASLLPRRTSGGGGGGGAAGGFAHGESGASGRTGARSGRLVTRSAARGGAAIGGAFALRAGDAGVLTELGLDLNELRALSPRMQCARILEAVLGDGSHPDEAALQRAAAEQLKAILVSEEPPSEADAIRGFVARFVFELMLVELQADLTGGHIDTATATRKEGRVWRWLEAKVKSIALPGGGSVALGQLRSVAAKLTQEAIRILRAGRTAA